MSNEAAERLREAHTYGPNCWCVTARVHEDDGHGACILCHEYVPHTDDGFIGIPFPCPTVRLAALEAPASSLRDDPYAIPNHLIRQFQDAIEERDEVLTALTQIEVVAWKRDGEAVMSLADVDKLLAVVERARAILDAEAAP